MSIFFRNFVLRNQKYRGVVAVVARQAHNLEVGGSSPPPATNSTQRSNPWVLFFA